MNSCIYNGEVTHTRFKPVRHFLKYSTVQNWYPGDKDGKGGIYNFVTKRGLCKGKNSKISSCLENG